jgi:hypothetical protein
LWNGLVEVHLKSSDWYRHNHHLDPNYENVILHVVWERDVEVAYPNGKNIPTLFQEVIRHPNPDVAYGTFAVVLQGYWKTHYNFGSRSAPGIKKLSRSFFDLIAINTLLPIRYAYTRYLGGTGEEELFRWVEKIPQEHNRITKLFDQLKVPIQHAGDSQGVLHLFKNYCQKNQCVSCNVGFHLMKL